MNYRPQHDQASTMTDQTSASSFLEKMLVVDLLTAYGQGIGPSLGGFPAIPQLDEDQVQHIATSPGREDVEVWSSTFSETFADLAAFRASLIHDPGSVTLSEIRTVNEVIDDAFASLATWLDSSPKLKAS